MPPAGPQHSRNVITGLGMSPAGPRYSRNVITGLHCVSSWTTTQSQRDHLTGLCLQLGRHSPNVITGCVLSPVGTTMSQCDHWTALCLQLGRHSRKVTQCYHWTGLRCVFSWDDTVAMLRLDCVVSSVGMTQSQGDHWTVLCLQLGHDTVAR